VDIFLAGEQSLGRGELSRENRLVGWGAKENELKSSGHFIFMKVLVIDVGGNHIKILASRRREPRQFDSGPNLTPREMVAGVKNLTKDWHYDVVSIGYPGPVRDNRPSKEPNNLGKGWKEFDYAKAFGRPVKFLNDAAMQALGSYQHGRMLFLGLGTGLGSAMIADGILEPMELGQLPYRKGTFEDYVGARGLKKQGKKAWRKDVADVVDRLVAALEPDEVVLGGGNVKNLKILPRHCRAGDNANSFIGGFRLWKEAGTRKASTGAERRAIKSPNKYL
jgi:polyphosphate glucokinase